jgi:MFS family permease
MSAVRSWAWIVPMQIGAFFGYVLFGFLADRFGRRPTFVFFVLAAAALVPLYGNWGRSPTALMALGPLVGFFGHGYFSVFGALLAELFPASIRATAQGLCYNIGRAAGGAAAPFVIGAAADRYGIGSALALTSVFFVAGAVLMLMLKETRGAELE